MRHVGPTILFALAAGAAPVRSAPGQRVDTLTSRSTHGLILRPFTDTLDTYFHRGASNQTTRGDAWIVQSLARTTQSGKDLFRTSSDWHDSTGRVNARQTQAIDASTLEFHSIEVRADVDSASASLLGDRLLGWVVPSGKTPRLFDRQLHGTPLATEVYYAALAMRPLQPGQLFGVASVDLYSDNNVEGWTVLKVVRADSVMVKGKSRPVWVLERSPSADGPPNGIVWLDKQTGRLLIRRGFIGRNGDAWVHALRGVTLPTGT